jgi:hypothetical protein
MSDLEEEGSASAHSGFEVSDATAIANAIRIADPTWKSGERVDTGELKWLSDLSRGTDHLHVHLADKFMPYMIERLKATSACGMKPHIAMPLQALFDEELILQLVTIEPMIHIIDAVDRVSVPEPLLVSLGKRWRVSSGARTAIGNAAWGLVGSVGTAKEKGDRLESLLCFLLGQIADFEVSEHKMRTETEEIDVVVTLRANSGRCWTHLGAPFVLVEAKNWHSGRVGQGEVSEFGFKAQHKRRTVRLGLMVGASGFTKDAREQTLRTSGEDLTIALLGPEEMKTWIDALDGDEALEKIIREAMLS